FMPIEALVGKGGVAQEDDTVSLCLEAIGEALPRVDIGVALSPGVALAEGDRDGGVTAEVLPDFLARPIKRAEDRCLFAAPTYRIGDIPGGILGVVPGANVLRIFDAAKHRQTRLDDLVKERVHGRLPVLAMPEMHLQRCRRASTYARHLGDEKPDDSV